MDADLVLFDPVTFIDNSTVKDYAAPNSGLKYVIVGGKIAVRDSKCSGVCEGKIIRMR